MIEVEEYEELKKRRLAQLCVDKIMPIYASP
jgi:hypothetical protein